MGDVQNWFFSHKVMICLTVLVRPRIACLLEEYGLAPRGPPTNPKIEAVLVMTPRLPRPDLLLISWVAADQGGRYLRNIQSILRKHSSNLFSLTYPQSYKIDIQHLHKLRRVLIKRRGVVPANSNVIQHVVDAAKSACRVTNARNT